MNERLSFASLLLLAACVVPPAGAAAEPGLVGTVWRWTALRGAEPLEVQHPNHYTLELQDDGRYALRADCNRGGGAWSRDGDRLTLAPGPLTLVACPPDSLADRFLALLGGGLRASVAGERLTLTLDDGRALEFAARRTLALQDTTWLVRGYNNGRQAVVSVLGDTTLTAAFAGDGRLEGSAGCNRYRGSYAVDGDALAIGPLVHTEKACLEPAGVMEQEATFLAALGSVGRWEPLGERLKLRTQKGSLAVDLVSAVTGRVTYRVRRALPPDARIEVRLEDVSRADAPAELLGETRFPARGRQVPFPFEIVFDPADVDPRHSYALRARIHDAEGTLLFATTQDHPVLTRDAPRFDVEVSLDPAR